MLSIFVISATGRSIHSSKTEFPVGAIIAIAIGGILGIFAAIMISVNRLWPER